MVYVAYRQKQLFYVIVDRKEVENNSRQRFLEIICNVNLQASSRCKEAINDFLLCS